MHPLTMVDYACNLDVDIVTFQPGSSRRNSELQGGKGYGPSLLLHMLLSKLIKTDPVLARATQRHPSGALMAPSGDVGLWLVVAVAAAVAVAVALAVEVVVAER